jgi:methyl-accepting chemotaxis protein
MTDLSNSSNRISKIIKVIDEIAFQTNILALNAAVEAARAGEAGLGFAVVAEQVRNLAQRCAQAAKDTESLIRDSIANTEGGKQKSDCVSKLVREVAAESAQIRTLMEEVRRGSEEQSRGMQQIAGALHQLGTVTQTSASTAEESAAAAEELSSQSHMVREVAQHLEQLAGTTSGGRRTLRVRRTSPA